VMEVLTAFIRNHSHEPGNDVPTSTTRSDVQAAGTVLRRRNASHDHERIDLARANLAHVTLTGADLCGADFAQADLTGANLHSAWWPENSAVPEGWQRDDQRYLRQTGPGPGGRPRC